MKKFNLLIAVAALATFSLTSCNKCQDCTCFGQTQEVCQEDFDSKDEYKDAIKEREDTGICKCK